MTDAQRWFDLARAAHHRAEWAWCVKLSEAAFAAGDREGRVEPRARHIAALLHLGRIEAALAACEAAIALCPEHPVLLDLRTACRERLEGRQALPATGWAVIAVLIPSLGRPFQARDTVLSACATAERPEAVRVLVGVEPGEVAAYEQAFGEAGAAWIHPLRRGGSYVSAMRELAAEVSADIYGLLSDDFRFETAGWDATVRRSMALRRGRLALVYGDDGYQGEALATAPFVSREWIETVGDVVPGDYEHLWCDTELTDIAGRAGMLVHLPHVRITHHHPLAGRSPGDATYERSARTYRAGLAVYARRAPERQRIAGVLVTAAREAPLLSLLIPSLTARAAALETLLAELRRQIAGLGDPSLVEVRTLTDSGETILGAKRNRLVAIARGHHVAFVDDDDMVAPGYVADLVAALALDPDCVTFRGVMTTDGAAPIGFDFSVSHARWGVSPDGVLLRNPNHLCAIRRRIALATTFPEAYLPEDRVWSDWIRPDLRGEVKIDRALYYYRFSPSGTATQRRA